MAKIFISYRRSDTGPYADRLVERLGDFQFEAVFLDRSQIRLGQNFADRIRQALAQCNAVLALIGPKWLDARDESGSRRLDDANDWVRREITLASRLKLPVVPVLFDGAKSPATEQLPRDLACLATSQGYDINGNYFDRDAIDLCSRLEAELTAAVRAQSTIDKPRVSQPVLDQVRFIWMFLFAVTLLFAVAPAVAPAFPRLFWLFPCAMTLAAFLWWLYGLAALMRPGHARAV
jgi:hypothetical protein